MLTLRLSCPGESSAAQTLFAFQGWSRPLWHPDHPHSSMIGWMRSRCCISVLYGSQRAPGTTEAQTEEASLAWAFRWVEPRRFELLTSCLQSRRSAN